MAKLRMYGEFLAECVSEYRQLEWLDHTPNAPTTEGLDELVTIMFAGDTSWYLGLIAGDGFSELAQADTLADHAGWTELTSYSQSTRPQWTPSVSGGLAMDPQVGLFTFPVLASVRGFFLASNSTKGGTTGTLWATALFGAARSVKAGKSLRVSYAVQAAGGG